MTIWLASHPWTAGWIGAIVYAECLWAVYR